VYVRTDLGTRPALFGTDGYFHLLDVLLPGQTRASVDVIVEHGGRTRTYYAVPLGQPGERGAPYGQAVAVLDW
jgi:hypothetical protein